MPKQSKEPREKTSLDPSALREIANLVRNYAEKYERAAAIVEATDQGFMLAGGIDSLEKRALKELRGNSSQVLKDAEALADGERLSKISEQSTSLSIKPKHVPDDSAPKRKPKSRARRQDE